MNKRKSSKRLLGKQVWCVGCLEESPRKINRADYMIPIRDNHYKLLSDDSAIDDRVIGICKECLKSRNQFQQENTKPVDVTSKKLVFRHI